MLIDLGNLGLESQVLNHQARHNSQQLEKGRNDPRNNTKRKQHQGWKAKEKGENDLPEGWMAVVGEDGQTGYMNPLGNCFQLESPSVASVTCSKNGERKTNTVIRGYEITKR